MKFNSINMKKMKKSVQTGVLVLVTGVAISTVIPTVTNMIEARTENLKKEAAYNNACGIVDAAKLKYAESLLTDDVIAFGNAADLKVSGTPATSGTWSTIDIDNDGMMEVLLKDVVIGDYVCNTPDAQDEYDIEVKRK